MKTMPDFDVVWDRIKKHQDEEFKTIKDARFAYEIIKDEMFRVLPPYESVDNRKSQFSKSLSHVPCEGPKALEKRVGSSYVWAILHDQRIRRDDW